MRAFAWMIRVISSSDAFPNFLSVCKIISS
jgi:hypothetical protein